MINSESVSRKSSPRGCQLRLVGGTRRHPTTTNAASSDHLPPSPTEVRRLTIAMMSRLWIPPTTTIVGLLDVGLSSSNFDELSKWIAQRLIDDATCSAADALPQLERRFLRAVDRFPEL